MGFRFRMSPAAEPTTSTARMTNAPSCTSDLENELAVRGNGHGSRRAAVGAGGLVSQQHLLRIHHAAAAERRELEDARVHPDGVLGAGLHAEPTEHALAEVDVEARGNLLDLGIRMLGRHDVDAV